MTTNQSRVSQGVPTGGQFATEPRSEPEVHLSQQPSFGDIVINGRGATTSAVVARSGNSEIRATLRVTHAEKGFYTGSVVRRVHDSATGESVMAPHELGSLGGAGTSLRGRFSAKDLERVTQEMRDRLLEDYAAGRGVASRIMSTELSEHDLHSLAAHGQRWRPSRRS